MGEGSGNEENKSVEGGKTGRSNINVSKISDKLKE